MKISENIPLSTLTTMRLGGPARFVIEITDPTELPDAFAFAKDKNLKTFILGGGANTIAKDEGFDGVIIRYIKTGISATQKDDYTLITAAAGEPWDNVVKFTTDKNLTGIEALSKIPGLAGAAPVQNIGAYGQDVSQVLDSAEVYDTVTGTFTTLIATDFHFSYRHSILNTTEYGRYVVLSITLKLHSGQMPRPFYNSIERYIDSTGATDFSPAGIRDIVSHIRADKLPDPLEKPSAGSFFKNIYLTPDEAKAAEQNGYPVYKGHDGLKINSAWLIENAGLSGALINGMRINEKAPLVLINESAHSYSDLAAARAHIIATIKDKFNYTLEQEPVEL